MNRSKYFVRSENPIISVEFECDGCIENEKKCFNIIKNENIEIPLPDCMIDEDSGYSSSCVEDVTCDKCGKDFGIKVYVSRADVYIEIPELDNNNEIKIEKANDVYYQKLEEREREFSDLIDFYLLSQNPFYEFIDSIDNLRKLNTISIIDEKLKNPFKRLLYAGAVTCLETYLSEILFKKVIENEFNIKKYISKCMNKNKYNSIIEKKEISEEELKKEVEDDIIKFPYHRLKDVKERYKFFFNIQIPDYNEISKIIRFRHIIIHRNGKDKSGYELPLDTNKVDETINKVEKFITDINSLVLNRINDDDNDELPW